MTILVAGATGTTGAAVTRALLSTGIPVRAMTRHADVAERLYGEAVEVAVADLIGAMVSPPRSVRE